jgi:phosphonate transport system substrate-binding protein
MYKQFMPLVERLQERMQQTLKREVAIEFRIFKSYDEAREALVAGQIDFVRFGPSSYVMAKEANPNISLLAMESKHGKKTFDGHIVVRANSPIRKLADIRGKRFAFGDPTSTIGRFLVQKELLDAGLHMEDLASHAYLGRHDLVFRAVELGDFDAGALKSSTFDKLNEKNVLRVLVTFENVTKPWVARGGMDPGIRGALAEALMQVRDPAALTALDTDELVEADDKEYDATRRSMTASRGFEAARKSSPAAPGKD